MKKSQTEIYYDDQTALAPPDTAELFTACLTHVAAHLKLKGHLVVSATIVDNETIRTLNRDYRGLDRPTDVISFAYLETDKVDGPITDLGEICIALSVAEAQAAEYSHPLRRELAFLFIHGTLHLLGYDHVNSEEEAQAMYNLQNELLNTLNYNF